MFIECPPVSLPCEPAGYRALQTGTGHWVLDVDGHSIADHVTGYLARRWVPEVDGHSIADHVAGYLARHWVPGMSMGTWHITVLDTLRTVHCKPAHVTGFLAWPGLAKWDTSLHIWPVIGYWYVSGYLSWLVMAKRFTSLGTCHGWS